jgi:chromosome partitioning protein
MRTVAFVSQKGGSGKSTIASSVAVAAHQTNEKVCVIDMDPQGSLTNWARLRAAGDIEVLASGAARLPALLAALERRGVTLALLDTPGAEGAASSAAMRVADLNIVPSRPSLFDLWASARARAALEEIGAKFVFLLNQCPPAQTARVQDGVEALEEMGPLISPLILARVEYQDAARRGRGVTELNPSGCAAQEMRGLWRSIDRRLAQAEVGRPAKRGLGLGQTNIGSPEQALVPALEMA